MQRALLTTTIVTVLLFAASQSHVEAGGEPSPDRTNACYGDQLSVDVATRKASTWASQSLQLHCMNRSGELYGSLSVGVLHEMEDGVMVTDEANAMSLKALLSTALLAQSMGRDVRVEFSGTDISLIPRGHADFDDLPSEY